MQIDEMLLEKLENLSALKIDDAKRNELIVQLSEIVNFVEKLNELDLDDKEVMISAINGGTPLREDAVENSEVVDLLLANAPKSNEHFFVVPKIIE